MSEITSPSGVVNVQWQEEKPADDQDQKHHEPPANKVAESYEENARAISDHITILGIPVELMTSQVQAMIGGLVSETAFLKSKIQRLERTTSESEVPLLEGAHFLSALENALRNGAPSGSISELVLVTVNTFEDIRKSSGILAANGVLADVATYIAESELQTSPVGLVGGPTIGALLTSPEQVSDAETEENVLSTADRVRAIVEGTSYSVSGLEMDLSFKVAAARVEPGQSALHAIGQVDHVLRS